MHTRVTEICDGPFVQVFTGSEALSTGALNRHQLDTGYQRIFPDVYAPKYVPLTLDARIAAAWLWSKRRGVISGVTAAALHGARWVGDDVPIELTLLNNKSPAGVQTRNDTLLDGETVCRDGMPVTSLERTAFDLARRLPVRSAVARLDALARAAPFAVDEVLAIGDRHPRLRGKRRVAGMLGLVDAGAESPKESWLRLVLIAAGFPRPATQIPLFVDGYRHFLLDLGWEEFRVAAEYDGQQHRTDEAQYRRDVARSEFLAMQGWRRVTVLAGDREPDIIRRVEQAGVPRGAPRRLVQVETLRRKCE